LSSYLSLSFSDNTVTVYKWHILTRLFGPWEHFFDNIKQYVLGKGFLGLINRIRAEVRQPNKK
jgi:hypothetical protein